MQVISAYTPTDSYDGNIKNQLNTDPDNLHLPKTSNIVKLTRDLNARMGRLNSSEIKCWCFEHTAYR